MKIFLFDMDGVLLESHGYHLALQETVCRMARALGFGDVTLSTEDIATFESGGISSEWDEAAISAALLLKTVWEVDPERRLPDSLAGNVTSVNPQPGPDFNVLAQVLSGPEQLSRHPLERAEHYFISTNHFTQAQSDTLLELLHGAHDPQRALTHRTFQELVLGSAEFTLTYGLPARLGCESYLLKYDISNLSSEESACLRDWIYATSHAAAVITSRPSRPPAGIFSTPEAELGAALVGLEGLPIAGWGGITWLGQQRRTDPKSFVKPSPVHALAALRMSLGEGQETALSHAADLVETRKAGTDWQRLDGAQVCIFEDTPGGIKSLQAAQETLNKAGIQIKTKYFGIAQKPVKMQALRANTAQVFPSLVEALSLAI
ncbi:MAG: hypothetical protein WCE68_07110 [Anaerolineales bacterium]